MPVICIGPICIPMNLLLPFLLGVLHSYGWLKWIKKDWVTFRYWKRRFDVWRGKAPPPPKAVTVEPIGCPCSAVPIEGGGGALKLSTPADDPSKKVAASVELSSSSDVGPSAGATEAEAGAAPLLHSSSAAAAPPAVRQRPAAGAAAAAGQS